MKIDTAVVLAGGVWDRLGLMDLVSSLPRSFYARKFKYSRKYCSGVFKKWVNDL
jgi:hypothetical protein